MANKSRFQIAKEDIIALFEASSQRVYTKKDITTILNEQRKFWRLAKSTTTDEFIELLASHTLMQAIEIQFPQRARALYTWDEVSPYELGLRLAPRAYLSHYTALYLHGLSEQIPKRIYVNHEQSPKTERDEALTQVEVDAAFSKPQRESHAVGQYGDYSFVLLNGKYTNRLGVVEQQHFGAGTVQITDIERTLIDLAVRAAYVGGVFEVLEAYRQAAGKVSINKLVSYLKKLNYRYPFQQSIGFYMEKSGTYSAAQLNLLRKLDKPLSFYLAHGMAETSYSLEWRLYYPKGL